MRVWRELLVLCLCLSCGGAFVFFKDKVQDPLEKVPCGAHSRVRSNFPAHAQGWLGNKCLWLFFGVVFYGILNLELQSDRTKSKDQTPAGLRRHPFRSPLKKTPDKDQNTFNALVHLEMKLVELLCKVQNLKATVMTSGRELRRSRPEFPGNPLKCVLMYEVWEDSPNEWTCVRRSERKRLSVNNRYPN